MARDAGLEDLIRTDLPREPGLSEKSMFGGWAWLLNGNLLCAARKDGMLTRLGKGREDWALALEDVGPMRLGRRTMGGWVRAGPEAYGDDEVRRRLIAGALEFVRGLPEK